MTPRGKPEMKIDWAKNTAILALMVFLTGSLGYTEESHLRVEITPDRTTVKNGEAISVITKVMNISHTNQQLLVWSCAYYDNWSVDSPFVALQAWSCMYNNPVPIPLKPGETYQRQLWIRIDVPAEELQMEKVTFRLGFKTSPAELLFPKELHLFGNVQQYDQKPPNEAPVIWSDPITLRIGEPLP